jgi:tRNA(fMet)-specific endonuclease VapC
MRMEACPGEIVMILLDTDHLSVLTKLIDFLGHWTIVEWDEPAAATFRRLRAARVRIGNQDPKIAATAMAQDPLHLSANLRDFEQVPGLNVEDRLYR